VVRYYIGYKAPQHVLENGQHGFQFLHLGRDEVRKHLSRHNSKENESHNSLRLMQLAPEHRVVELQADKDVEDGFGSELTIDREMRLY